MTAPDHTGSRPGFAALLRAGLPSRPLDFAPFILVALVMRFVAGISWPGSAAGAVVVGLAAIALSSAGVRVLTRRASTEDAEPDPEADGDGS